MRLCCASFSLEIESSFGLEEDEDDEEDGEESHDKSSNDASPDDPSDIERVTVHR